MTDAFDSRLPPDTFGGAIDLGVLDHPLPIAKEGAARHFLCATSQVKLRKNLPFSSWFFKFELGQSSHPLPTRINFLMRETPKTTIYLELYDSRRQLLKTYRGNDFEQIEETFDAGLYYIRLLISDAPPDAEGFYTADISVAALPVAVDPTFTPPGRVEHIGSVAEGKRLTARGAIWSLAQREPQPVPKPFVNHCAVTSQLNIRSHALYAAAIGKSTTLRINYTVFNNRNWSRDLLGIYIKNQFGTYTRLNGNTLKVKSGLLEFAFGYVNVVDYIVPDAFVDFELAVEPV